MSTQPELDFAARARTLDPDTSHLAAQRVTDNGRAMNNRQLCFDAIVREPGLTSGEVAAITGLDRHEAARRLPELREDRPPLNRPLLANLPPSNPRRKRTCRICGTPSLTWWLAEAQVPTTNGKEP